LEPHSKRYGSTDAAAASSRASGDNRTTRFRPIAPGNGSVSPPPWELDRSGGLFVIRAVRDRLKPVLLRQAQSQAEACPTQAGRDRLKPVLLRLSPKVGQASACHALTKTVFSPVSEPRFAVPPLNPAPECKNRAACVSFRHAYAPAARRRKNHPLDHGRNRGLGCRPCHRRVDVQPRCPPAAGCPRLRSRISRLLGHSVGRPPSPRE
jgi:hypothetical protein